MKLSEIKLAVIGLGAVAELFFRQRLSQIGKLQNIHDGDSCYIFGDGPSIKWFDFKYFGDKPSICCGMIPFHKDFNTLDVRYCSLVEPWLFCPDWAKKGSVHLKELTAMAKNYVDVIEKHQDKSFFVNLSNTFSLTSDNIFYVNDRLYGKKGVLDPDLMAFNVFEGSFYASLAIAYHLGFKSVYLVGFDAWTLQPALNKRWYEKGRGEEFMPTNFALDYLKVLKRHMDIYTISPGGKSQNVECIDYEEFTGGIKPRFRENTELMDPNYLDALSKRSFYQIY
jgi:hypothetical protein